MVGKTAPIKPAERRRMETIREYCGCLPCLLMGFPDRLTTIEHVTNRGSRVGQGSEHHRHTIGLCEWHHFGERPLRDLDCCGIWKRAEARNNEKNLGPSLANGRIPFEKKFGDELHVLVPVQDYLLELFDANPWGGHNIDRMAARLTRNQWILKKRAANRHSKT